MAPTPVTWLKVGDVLDLATAPGGSRVTGPPPEVAVVTGLNPPTDDPPDDPWVGVSLAGGAYLWMPRDGRITVIDNQAPTPGYWRQSALAQLSRRPASDLRPEGLDTPDLVRLFLGELARLLDESRDGPGTRETLVRIALLAVVALAEIDEAALTSEDMPLR
jgi:hypothetical protein